MYDTKKLETKRLIIDKGNSESCKKIYEYDLIKCTEIDSQNSLVKFEEPPDFIGDNAKGYYNECQESHMFDWYVYLKKGNIPVANIIADRENIIEKSIELSYNTHPNYWGNGYITEALEEILKFLKNIGYAKIVIHFYEGNNKSKRVCEKLNFKFVKKEKKLYEPSNKIIDENKYVLEFE
ncbi:MAG: GNAT family N-acetyltransferase [Bacilli bacterium]|nr:GNAT family N-acetyltransferase [Bacilli bacterium]